MSSDIQICPYCRKQIVRPRPGVKFHSHCAREVDRRRVKRSERRYQTAEEAEQPIDIAAGKESLDDCEAKRIGRLLVASPVPAKVVPFDWLSLPLVARADAIIRSGPGFIDEDAGTITGHGRYQRPVPKHQQPLEEVADV